MSNITIKNPREYRLLCQLYHHGKTSRKDLDDIIGALNSPQHVSELRKRNEDILLIKCAKKSMKDRDGKITRPGSYYLTEAEMPLVKDALERWKKERDGATSPSKPDKSDN